MHRDILPDVIFSPATLALQLCEGLEELGCAVTLYSPGPVDTPVRNITANLTLFEQELAGRGDSYVDLLRKHPATFIALARQVQAELIAAAFAAANRDELDIVHIYTNEEDIALPFAQLCTKPVVFTHHDPFNFLIRYKNTFPKYAHLNWISMSHAQRQGMPKNTNWIANIPHGLPKTQFRPNYRPQHYVAYLGRIIEPKGLHLAIAALQAYNRRTNRPLTLKIAGKHYSGSKDSYWQERISPLLNNPHIEYVGFINSDSAKQAFLGQARAVMAPSTYDEPFGMVVIEALACGTPVIGLNSGAIPEIISDGRSGIIVPKGETETATIAGLSSAIDAAAALNREHCRADFEARFTAGRMARAHVSTYRKLINERTTI